MKKAAAGLAFELLIMALSAAVVWLQPVPAQAQTSPVIIPLQYLQTGDAWRIGINVGINGGAPQLYMFDTGSSVFNAVFNSATWGGFGSTAPNSTVPKGQGVEYCYGGTPGANCYHGNLVQVPNLSFYAPGATAGSTPAVTLSASPGYQIDALYNATNCGVPYNIANCGYIKMAHDGGYAWNDWFADQDTDGIGTGIIEPITPQSDGGWKYLLDRRVDGIMTAKPRELIAYMKKYKWNKATNICKFKGGGGY